MPTLGGRRFGPLTLGGRPDYQALFPAPKFVPTGSLTATPRTIGGSIEGGIAGALHKFGLSEKRAAQYGRRIMAPLNDVTPVGNVTGAEDGANLFRSGLTQGNLRAMGLGAGVFGLSVLPGPVGKKAGKAAKGMFGNMMRDTSGAIRAWHGSPHDFDRFDMSKIGTGEGAQAYGHGLYFAENPAVAKEYQAALATGRRGSDDPRFVALGNKPLSNVHPDLAHDIAEQGAPAIDRRLSEIRETLGNEAQNRRFFGDQQTDEMLAYFKREQDELEAFRRLGDFSVNPGRLYEVNINAEPEDFLDWDRPLSEYSPRAQSALEPLISKRFGGMDSNYRLGSLGRNPDGQKLVQNLTTGGGVLEQQLRGAGLPGIRYLDQGSRGAANGTRNYVVFDDSLIDILNKF